MTSALKDSKKYRWLLVLAGALLGAVAFFCVNTGASLDVTNDTWIRDGYVEKDIIQHYTGWLFYRQSPLGFPLGMSEAMNYPQGAAVTYTDSVPLMAIMFRILSPLLPQTFQYFGLYTLLCYMLQGASAALLLTVFLRSPAAVLLGSGMFILSPIMIERAFRHTALASHFLILFALYLYFANKHEGPWRYRRGYLVLAGLATAIHPYFLPMIFAILFADLIEHMILARKLIKPVLFLLAAFAVVGAVGFSIGAFSTPSSGGSTGYGYFCMNLNSVFNPVSCSGIQWSRVLPALPQGLGSYDGFNYLGLGILISFPLAVLLWMIANFRTRLWTMLKTHFGLIFVCACLTAFAVSCTVLANTRVLLTIQLPAFLMNLGSTFRSSGRMFYPVYYLILLFTVAFFGRRFGEKKGAVLLALILAVQAWDISPALAVKRAYFTSHEAAFENPMQSEFWSTAAGHYEHMFSLDDLLLNNLYFSLYAADNDMTTNDPFTARYDAVYHQRQIENELEKLQAGEIEPDTMYITSNRNLFFDLSSVLCDKAICAQVDDVWYVIAPDKEGVKEPEISDDFITYEEYPLMLEDLTNDGWTHGVLNDDKSICTVLDNAFTRQHFADAQYIVCEGKEYKILYKDYGDAGWLMMTLDIDDASVLAGKVLQTR